MNTELLLKIKEQILKEPRQFQMVVWFSKQLCTNADATKIDERKIKKTKIPNCGTAACIAGWAAAIITQQNPANVNCQATGVDFGVVYTQYEKLIRFNSWPEQFRKVKNEGTKAFAQQAARRIDHFIATNGEE